MTNAEAPRNPAESSPPKTVSQMLGEITWLMSQSPLHRQLFISDLEWFAMPALLHEQYRVFYGPNAPAAVALWASVSDEVQARLENGAMKLRPDEWRSGDHVWLIELVAPFGGVDEILADLAANVFLGRSFRYHTTTPEGARVVKVFDGPYASS